MDVTTPEQARIAEEAGACAVMALERVPADIRREGCSYLCWSFSRRTELTLVQVASLECPIPR